MALSGGVLEISLVQDLSERCSDREEVLGTRRRTICSSTEAPWHLGGPRCNEWTTQHLAHQPTLLPLLLCYCCYNKKRCSMMFIYTDILRCLVWTTDFFNNLKNNLQAFPPLHIRTLLQDNTPNAPSLCDAIAKCKFLLNLHLHTHTQATE